MLPKAHVSHLIQEPRRVGLVSLDPLVPVPHPASAQNLLLKRGRSQGRSGPTPLDRACRKMALPWPQPSLLPG